jgi:hypothetical protein
MPTGCPIRRVAPPTVRHTYGRTLAAGLGACRYWAALHVGQTETVCGLVASTRYAFHARRQPTFLNFGGAYPDQAFTAVIWGDHRADFGTPEKLAGSTGCVTGPIVLYRGKPEVVLQSGDQLRTTSRIAAH